MSGYAPWDDEVASELIDRSKGLEGALLPILHALQVEFGYVAPAAVPLIAERLNLSRAEVHGAMTFYDDFRDRPAGGPVVRLCRAEACQALGCEGVVRDLRDLHGVVVDAHAGDGAVVETVYCLGNCALGPSALVDGHVYGRVDAARVAALCAPVVPTMPDPAQPSAASAGGAKVRVFVPADAAASSVGADAVATAIAREAARRGAAVDIVRNGSRGMLWLEPLVEVEHDGTRLAYGPVSEADVPALFAAGFLTGAAHVLALGPTEALPWLARQDRLTFARVGVTDPLSLAAYRAHGGLAGLERALAMSPAEVVEAVRASGLRGRGGAGFPTGIKWKTVLDASVDRKYVVCNADEGDSGTFADRMLMEGDPFVLIEGMAIAAIAVGATRGYVYVRSEYPRAAAVLRQAIAAAERGGVVGASVLGSGRPFRLEVRVGAGAYICGEETSLLESLEGKRGVVRAKPPLPALAGLFGRPTIVNNVLSLATVPWILAHGAEAYAARGMGRSRGTMPVQLAGNVAHGGLVELGFGVTLRTLIEDFGGGTCSGRPVRAVQIGGPLGAYLPAHLLDTPLDYEALAAAGGMLGHAGIVVFDDTVDMAEQARFAFAFCAKESCGKCTPCRIGSVRGVETMDRIIAGQEPARNIEVLRDLGQLMTDASLCAMGGLTPMPVLSALDHFPEDFDRRPATLAAAE